PLADYLMHRVLDLARQYNKPIQIHTGLQAGDGNYIENANPALLANLFLKYRDVRFVLFHGGYPFGSELASLAKNFRNVYIDLCWLYIISPSYSERYLHEWLETVPANKILAFGGDYENVENIYGTCFLPKRSYPMC
ncbi:MAG TPA: amidohydrolase family protein, partial [Prolixibacteraceae bacterium]|nr:amidohydrolase family protein [Prolixibacteraceae bacterium]